MKRLLIVLAGLMAGWAAAGEYESPFDLEMLPDLPDKEGFAGVFAGIAKDGGQDLLVVAGGANFPDGRPWVGGKKVYYDGVYTLALGKKAEWVSHGAAWPEKIAYGMSVTLPERNSSLFIGGKSNSAPGEPERASRAVREITMEDGVVVVRERTPLPLPCVEGVAGLVDGKVIVVGGATNKSENPGDGFVTSRKVFVLDISKDESKWAWEEWSWPQDARGRVYAVSGVRDKKGARKFYLFGGRDDAPSKEEAEERVVGLDFLRDCWELNVETQSWRRLADLPYGLSAAPSGAVPAGVSHFLVLGGVTVRFWRDQIKARPVLNGQGMEHPGFSGSILAYDTITDTWAGALTMDPEVTGVPHWSAVTTPVVLWRDETNKKDRFLVPTGEIKPGVRSPQVLSGILKEEKASLGLVNWIVVAVYLLGMVGIGYWFMKRKAAATTEAYFRGGQKIPFWVAGLSIFATVLSSITFMSIPARAYQTDTSWYVGQLAMLIIVPLVAFCYLPFFRKLDLTSAYLYLERRFNLAVRLFGSLSFIILHIGRVAIVLYLPAVALAAVSKIDVNSAILIIGVLCVIYTVMGGIEAVVWTDAVQAIVLMGGAILCLVLVIVKVDGGAGAVMELATTDNKLFQNMTWTEFSIKDGTTTVVVLFVAFFFNSFLQYTSGQDVIQRYVTTKDVAAARKSLWTTMWMSVFGSMIFFALGTALYAFYKTQPALLDPAMTTTDGILPFFIMQQLPAGVAGLIIAAVFAASQSSVSSSLNSVATAWTKDFDERLIRPNAEDQRYLKSAKVVVVIAGVLGIGVAVFMANSGIENAFKTFLGIVGLSSGSLGGLFALGVFTKKANGTGAMVGALAGIVAVATVKFGGAEVTGLLYAFIGFTTCLVVGYLVSLLAGGTGEKEEGLSVHG